MSIVVPNLIGEDAVAATARLDKLGLRYVQNQKTTGPPFTKVIDQHPTAGTDVKKFAVVTMTISSIVDLDNRPIEGPFPSGNLEGSITGVTVEGRGAFVDFSAADTAETEFILYSTPREAANDDLPRTEWMRRGAMLGLAQRALTSAHRVQLFVNVEKIVEKIRIFPP